MLSHLAFRLFSPMAFKKPGEFSPQARGPQVRARSWAIPLPTTLLGAVATRLIEQNPPQLAYIQKTTSWLDELSLIFGKERTFRGPYLTYNGDIFLYLEFQEVSTFLKPEAMEKFIEELGSDWKTRSISSIRDLLKSIAEDDRFSLKLKTIEFTGQAIQDPLKRVKTGYLYNIQLVDYSELAQKGEAYLCLDVLGEKLNLQQTSVIGLGGERRLAELSEKEGTPLREKMEDVWKDVDNTSYVLLYLLSPALYRTGNNTLEILENKLRERKLKLEKIISLSTLVSPIGFAAKAPIRKPIYNIARPGSIIVAKTLAGFSHDELYKLGISQEGERFGFGTVFPFPISTQGFDR